MYPNHLDFPQLEAELLDRKKIEAKPSATFSTQDIKRAKAVATAASAFYSYGRAVTWFLAVLFPLKITPVKFFEDFYEWQKLNHFGLDGDWEEYKTNHKQIEKLQLDFLRFKYEEKTNFSFLKL